MKIYFNKMQHDVMNISAKDNVIVAGRGTGKGMLHAAVNLKNFQMMPGSTTAFVAPNTIRAKTNTLPSMFQHWENWGYKREVHWCVGHRPPKSFDWPKPIIEPENYENIISFYNGAIGQIISQDRVGTSNSKSFDFIDIDEAKFINFERLKEETFQANRGQVREFGNYYAHHGMLVTSDMPVTKSGSWFMKYQDKYDPELIQIILNLKNEIEKFEVLERNETIKEWQYHKLTAYRKRLREFRSKALFFNTYSTLTNIEVLGEEYIRNMKRDLPPMVFQTSIMCIPVDIVKDGFYSSMKAHHKYNSANFNYLDNLEWDIKKLKQVDSRMDADIQQENPICIAFDYNRNINWLVAGQTDYDLSRLNVIKSFWVKYERKLPELISDFCKYYNNMKTKVVYYYYDSTALGSNYAVNDKDFKAVIVDEFTKHSWKIIPVYVGAPMPHGEKHLIINGAFSGQERLMPYFNEENNEDLLMSIQTAGVYNGKKDKRAEKLAETEEDKLEYRTDGSDAFDTLVIGALRFPQYNIPMPVSSNWS